MSRAFSLDPSLYAEAVSPVDQRLMQLMSELSKTPLGTDSSKPRVSLVVGPSPFSMPRGWEFFLTTPYEGLSYIATVLHNAGYPTRIIDVRYTPDPLGCALQQVLESSDVVGIATLEDNYPFVEELVALLKDVNPDLPIILGGSLVTSVPQVFMRETRADVAVISEGELTILELLEAYTEGLWQKRLPEIRGIWYRTREGVVHRNPPRGQMPTLDYLPNMNLSLWPQANGPRGLQPQIISSYSRGCRMDCSFCYRTTPRESLKSLERFREEMHFLKDHYAIEFIMFADLTFTADKRTTLEYNEVIKEIDIGFGCMTRCADVDEEILSAMAAAGCRIILFGVESLSPAVLRAAHKGSAEHIVLRAMRMSLEAGIAFGGLTIVGLPNETEESLEHMCAWAEENRHITRVKYLSAMPGTAVYRQGLEKGIIKDERDHLCWLSVEQALEGDEFLNYNGLPEHVMRSAYRRIYDCYQPGPVMNFRHFPEHFEYFEPRPAPSWRSAFSSAAAPMAPGHERFYRGYGRV